ncbi:AraC family transcriptional regulator [Hymenobacter jeollabukensis]|uniref:AraC family transcriptional regulator n=1 Tax=Hymenobacter jeollabukensis TaxID=2025313 RepID=A0A5R8WNV6_9BACT|nr:helix-turn-helix transcriptional regulator [Hymenobacter jeollabukensis]TLM91757.1 AraC family transcriptional regulator [Hymenobacter jeollabukensis]
MTQSIPTYRLESLSPQDEAQGVYFIDQHTPTAGPPLGRPYRGNYYKIGLCLRGTATLKANLETYAIGPGSLMVVTPHVIKEWTDFSADHEGLSVFFTREFITASHNIDIGNFNFLENASTHVLQLTPGQLAELQASFEFLRQKYHAPHAYRASIVKNLINNLLYEVVAVYDQQRAAQRAGLSRGQLLAAGFKQLLGRHGVTERSVKFYAEQLCITPKHLTDTVKDVTGKTAGAWIAEVVVLEAQALLQNQQLTVAQISDLLHFTDQSAFSRFFKKSIGLSPTAYKQAC